MAEPPKNPSDGPGRDAGAEIVSEQELDDTLARASSLAGELAQQIGTDDGGAPGAGLQETDQPAAGDGEQDVDAALSELENLIEAASEELDGGETPGEPPADAPATSAGGADDAAAPDGASEDDIAGDSANAPGDAPGAGAAGRYEVPDFMSEFMDPEPARDTQPAEGAVAAAAAEPAAGPASDEPDATGAGQVEEPAGVVVGANSVGVVSTPGFQSAPPRPKVIESETQDDAPPELPPETPLWQRLASNLRWQVEHACVRAAEHLVRVLERIDRPFAVLGERAREAAGWAALATLGTSLIVFVYTLL